MGLAALCGESLDRKSENAPCIFVVLSNDFLPSTVCDPYDMPRPSPSRRNGLLENPAL